MNFEEIIEAIPQKPYFRDPGNIVIYCDDCRNILPLLPDRSIDLVLTDPPYGITSNPLDCELELPVWWDLIKRLSRTFIYTAAQPFASMLVISQLNMFRHEWIWLKNRGSNFANTVREPMKEHEHILVFSQGKWIYNPQMQNRSGAGEERVKYKVTFKTKSPNYRDFVDREGAMLPNKRVPSSVQFFETEVGLHPTQKPTALFSYLVETYSLANNLILDPFLGSGTTLVCAKKLGRQAIGIEIEERYCEISANRCRQMVLDLNSTIPSIQPEPSLTNTNISTSMLI